MDNIKDIANSPVKVVKCRQCGVDVTINANYPIHDVGCQPWYCPDNKQNNEKLSQTI